MTNGEKYKTAEEKAKAFDKFCDAQPECFNCELGEEGSGCPFKWLELEYKEELKPCPFCGGTPTVISTLVTTDGTESRDIVMCNTCGIQFHEQNAIEKWNKRV